MAEQEQSLAIGIQKPTGSTNLGEETAALLIAGGLKWKFPQRVDFAPTNIKNLEIVAMRNGDLTRACARREIDVAIVGRDKYWDYDGPYTSPVILKELGYSQCTVKLGVRTDFPFTGLEDLKKQTIATSYVRGSARWFRERGIPVSIYEYEGGEEIGPARLWRTNAVACIAVSDTGDSMEANNAKAVMEVLKSEAILIANPEFADQPQSQKVFWDLLRTIMTGIWQTQYTLLEFNYPESAENQIMAQTPARESPTKMPLDAKGWKAARTLMPITSREEVETNLLGLGAKDLVYSKVERMVPNVDDVEVTRMMRAIYGQNWQFSNNLL